VHAYLTFENLDALDPEFTSVPTVVGLCHGVGHFLQQPWRESSRQGPQHFAIDLGGRHSAPSDTRNLEHSTGKVVDRGSEGAEFCFVCCGLAFEYTELRFQCGGNASCRFTPSNGDL
jgi:hypothetical protein